MKNTVKSHSIAEKCSRILHNPVFIKETKLRVRNIKFGVTILVYNLILLMIAAYGFEVMYHAAWDDYVDYGQVLFVYMALVFLEAMMVAFLVPSFTAGSIAGEREKQTLDILLTTPMRPGEIVWGKLFASVCMVVLLVISSLPILSLIYTIGGVSLMEMLQFVGLIIVAAIYLGSIGVWASTFIRRTVPATVFTFGGLVIVCAVSFVIVGAVYILYYTFGIDLSSGMEVTEGAVDISFILLILLINPAVSLIEMLTGQFSGTSLMKLMNESFSGDYSTGLPNFLLQHWFVISLIVQIVLAILIMKLAAKNLDPIGKKNKKRLLQAAS